VNQISTFVIRRAFVLPMGLVIALTFSLLIVCVMQGQPTAKIIILAFLIIPQTVLFVECAFRRLVVEPDRITAFRPFRQRVVCFADVTSLETVQVRSRVFLTLTAGDDDFLIISNAYADFPALVESLVAAVPEATVTEETQQMAKKPPVRQADIFTAWFAVIALGYVLLAQFKV